MPGHETTRPSRETREAERGEADRGARPDRDPTPEEEAAAEGHDLGDVVSDHYQEMAERGAHQQGEGRVP